MPNFLAVDLGASNGRVLLGRWDGAKFELAELHRFSNGPVHVLGHMYWDALRLWSEIKTGLSKYAATFKEPPISIAIDTWGVDFALLDRQGHLLGNPFHYRDPRTDGVPARLFSRVPAEEVFERTGIQFMQINTLFQLFSMVESGHPHLDAARTLLMMPDLFHYWLTGTVICEYTIASTSQMLDARTRVWATEIVERLGIPVEILPDLVNPGETLGTLLPEVAEETGLSTGVSIIAAGSHDTASAVAAVPGLDEQSAYISSGTWSLMGLEMCSPVINPQTMRLNITNEGGVGQTIRLLKNITGLWLLQECRRKWQREGSDFSWDELLALASESQPLLTFVDPDCPDFLNPPDMPAAIRSFCRRTGQPEPATTGQIVRCCLESLALKYRHVLNLLQKVSGRTAKTIRIVGGGCQNRLLCQLTADACHCEVITGPVEATALGNIMVQAISGGFLESVEAGRRAVAASISQETFTPRDGDWDKAFERFSGLLAS
ncbi:MAG TPA: rhamnulokinase family protein [Acidobacteriota bacterium]|nr:rhamnulokinase family protein [Acidobacteriota bacterium]